MTTNSANNILNELIKRSDIILNNLRQAKDLKIRRFSVTEAAKLVGRDRQTIYQAEVLGKLPAPETETRGKRENSRIGYSLQQINTMRKYFGTCPWRASGDEPCILAIQNFKGGVGKSNFAIHIAEFLAIKGYRVLLIDGDSQASATAALGFIPDDEVEAKDTLYPFFNGEENSLEFAIRKTHWDGLDLIPACLMLYASEYRLSSLQASSRDSGYRYYERLSLGIETIKDKYDIVLLDSPPALGMISQNILYASNALIIPVVPAMYDLASTRQYFLALNETLDAIGDINLNFFRVFISRYDVTSESQTMFATAIRDAYGSYCMNSGMLKTDEILNASALFSSVYDLNQAIGSKKTYNRAISILDSIGSEVEHLIKQTWPSHVKQMREKGLMVV
jgi:chromosome partitioning protein